MGGQSYPISLQFIKGRGRGGRPKDAGYSVTKEISSFRGVILGIDKKVVFCAIGFLAEVWRSWLEWNTWR